MARLRRSTPNQTWMGLAWRREWAPSHGEGHIVVAVGAPSAAFRPAPAAVRTSAPPIPAALVLGLVAAGLIVVLTIALAVTARRRRVVA